MKKTGNRSARNGERPVEIARLRAANSDIDESAGYAVIKAASLTVFNLRHIYYSVIRITSSGWVASAV